MTHSDVIQFTYTVPPEMADVPSAVDYMEKSARSQFGEALFDWVKEHNGGIVGPIHEREETRHDWLFQSGTYRTVSMYCKVTDLPAPPEFLLMGGPADGITVRTDGGPVWRVPMAPPMPSVVAYGEDPTYVGLRYAEYERVNGAQAYRFRRVSA